MAPISVSQAIYSRLSSDDDLRAALVALLPSGEPRSETDLLRRFSLAPGPQPSKGSPTYPLILWRLISPGGGGGTRCGTLGSVRARWRVWIENQGRGLVELGTTADRIQTLLSGHKTGGITFVCDAPWTETPTGAAGDYVEAGFEFVVISGG